MTVGRKRGEREGERGRKGREKRRRGREGEMMEARVESHRPRVGMTSISQEGSADPLGHIFWSFSPCTSGIAIFCSYFSRREK